MSRQTATLELRALCKRYGPVAAVDDISLAVESGELVTFLGASGSGKSTTLFMIAGLETPSSGEILLGGRSLLGVAPHRRGIGMVFQRYSLFPRMTVAENIAFPLQVRRVPRAEIAARVTRALDLVQLGGMADRRPATLSGGQQQRVAVARALVYEPPLLLMDEPLAALDKSLREEIQAELKDLHRRLDVTILFVTHDQDEALRLSDRIAVFGAGRIAQFGTPDEIYHRPESSFVAGFFGNANFLDVSAGNGLPPDMVVSGAGKPLRTNRNVPATAGQPLRMMVRPHEVSLLLAPRESPADNQVEAEIRELIFMGDHTVVTLYLPEERMVWTATHRTASIAPPTRGARVTLGWPVERTHILPHA